MKAMQQNKLESKETARRDKTRLAVSLFVEGIIWIQPFL
ncbi:hypothetical protein CLNEO_25280 [Anaerotignum neopropionicum]|uniref:Uncharacterized protein n=1 Tax=Anaerotignum neopropionicum TaxID=36847 RepID=A0A136WBY7_9FIRM|nr:hypothetical protein CLNEO_25280 [Anaerotignum neopropionicum]